MVPAKHWLCPKCSTPTLAPARLPEDDLRRFCLDCSTASGKLTRRFCPWAEPCIQRLNFVQEASRVAKAMNWWKTPTLKVYRTDVVGNYRGACFSDRWFIILRIPPDFTPVQGAVLLIHELAHLYGPDFGSKPDKRGRTVHGEAFIRQMHMIAERAYGVSPECDPRGTTTVYEKALHEALDASKWKKRWEDAFLAKFSV